MRYFFKTLKERFLKQDFLLLFCVVALTGIGIATHYGAREIYGKSRVAVQLIAAALGLVCMLLISMTDYQDICEKLTIPLFIAGILALILTLILGSAGDFGGKSWIKIPHVAFNIQPSEFVKLFLIVTLARHIDVLRDRINRPLSVLRLLAHVAAFIILVILQDDLGTALVYLVIALHMLFAGGLSIWYFLGGLGIAALAFPYLWPHLSYYQRMRILVGFNPDMDPTNYGTQAIASRRAIASGGLWGKGIDGGELYDSVPMANNDFVLSMIGEKFGFIGCLTVIILYTVLIFRLIHIALRARKDTGALIAVGVAGIFIAQVTENIGMALAVLPVVGITLPFLSYGGSSLLSLFLSMGMVQSVCTHAKKYNFEREST